MKFLKRSGSSHKSTNLNITNLNVLLLGDESIIHKIKQSFSNLNLKHNGAIYTTLDPIYLKNAFKYTIYKIQLYTDRHIDCSYIHYKEFLNIDISMCLLCIKQHNLQKDILTPYTTNVNSHLKVPIIVVNDISSFQSLSMQDIVEKHDISKYDNVKYIFDYDSRDRFYLHRFIDIIMKYLSGENGDNKEKEPDPEESGDTCIICFENSIDSVPVPCGHMSFCNACITTSFNSKSNCPLCRTPITEVVKIYK